MQEPSKETRDFVKNILMANTDPSRDAIMNWFRCGAWYMDALYTMILALPDDDPSLTKVLGTLVSGRCWENQVVAENVLRWEMSKAEMSEFSEAASPRLALLLHARVLVQTHAKEEIAAEEEAAKLSPIKILVATFKAASCAVYYGIQAAGVAARNRKKKR